MPAMKVEVVSGETTGFIVTGVSIGPRPKICTLMKRRCWQWWPLPTSGVVCGETIGSTFFLITRPQWHA